jgi:CTP:molybdopterin cytidylyltransferase MocA
MPFVSEDLLRRLWIATRGGTRAVFAKASGRVGFPFGLPRTALPTIECQLARREFSLRSLARGVGALALRVPRAQAAELFNINTPADWSAARQRWRELRRLPAAILR